MKSILFFMLLLAGHTAIAQLLPTPQGEIIGETRVCNSVTYDYFYDNTLADTSLVWEVSEDAVIYGSNTGSHITVVFKKATSYEIRVKRVSTSRPKVASDWLRLHVTAPEPDFKITNDDRLSVFCPSTTTSFTADFGDIVPDYIEWRVFTGSYTISNTNFGTILEGTNQPRVTVRWNEIYSSPTGTLLLLVVRCGQTYYFPVPITLYQSPAVLVDHIEAVHPKTPEITVNVATPDVNSGSLLFDFGNGNTETQPLNPKGVYRVKNHFANSSTENTLQTLTVSLQNPNGCFYSPSDTKIITVYPDIQTAQKTVSEKYYLPCLDSVVQCDSEAKTYTVTLYNNTELFGINPNEATFRFSGQGITETAGGLQHTLTGLTPGTYTYTLTCSAPDMPAASVEQSITLAPFPEIAFLFEDKAPDVSDGIFCTSDVITFVIPDYDPANTYSWLHSGTQYYASGPTTQISFQLGEVYPIMLSVKTPQGYETESDLKAAFVPDSHTQAYLVPGHIDTTEDKLHEINIIQTMGGSVFYDEVIWMRGNEQVGTGRSFTPSKSGRYWAVLVDSNGCKDNRLVMNPVNVIIRKSDKKTEEY